MIYRNLLHSQVEERFQSPEAKRVHQGPTSVAAGAKLSWEGGDEEGDNTQVCLELPHVHQSATPFTHCVSSRRLHGRLVVVTSALKLG